MRREAVMEYVSAQPFRAFRIRLNSGRTYEIRHPEMIRVARDYVLVFEGATPEGEIEGIRPFPFCSSKKLSTWKRSRQPEPASENL